MLLKDKVSVIYGGGGVVGGAIARALGKEGSTVVLAGRSKAKLDAVAKDIVEHGGRVTVAEVDALDPAAVGRHVDAIAAEAGRIDVAVNAVGLVHVQGTSVLELSLEEYEAPIQGYLRTHFVTAQAVARRMVAQRSGVILTISTPAARAAFPGVVGFGTACAAIEGLTRHLAADLGSHGVRVVCLRPDALPEAIPMGSHSRAVFAPLAARQGITVEAMLARPSPALLGRFPRLEEVARAAVFAASDHAGAMTGVIMNLTCGSTVD